MLKKLLKSALVILIAVGTSVGATNAAFTSSVTAADNEIVAGTLRLAIDSTRAHIYATPYTWNGGFGGAGAPYDSYTVVQDVNGVSTAGLPLETWTNAAPGTFVPYVYQPGADVLADGNHSYWIALRNAGTVPLKVKANVTGGSWTMDPAVAATVACTGADLNAVPTVSVRNVHIYATDNCESHEECHNIYYGLKTGPWTNATTVAYDYYNPGYTPLSGPVYASSNGTSGGTPIQINGQQFIVARVDVNFDDTLVAPAIQNCYQGATFSYDLTGDATQVGGAW
jgi:predicted ribosomally synthesized peptide with SipW-like signal peptide